MQVSHLKIRRDIYYTVRSQRFRRRSLSEATERSEFSTCRTASFSCWATTARAARTAATGTENFVDRRLLIGKALFIYWPHPWWSIGSNLDSPEQCALAVLAKFQTDEICALRVGGMQ